MLIAAIDKATPAASGVTWQLRRGTTVPLSANVYPAGDITIEAVGEGPPPVILVPTECQLAFMAGPGQTVSISGVRFSGPPGGKPGSGIAVGKGGRLLARSVTVSGFVNGLLFSGDDSVIDGCVAWDVSTGIFGGRNDRPAPSRCVMTNLHIRAKADSITLHDGESGGGRDNIIRNATLHAEVENGLDFQPMYNDTLVEDVAISCPGGLYPVIWDGDRTTLRRVRILAARRPVYSRGGSALIEHCDLGANASDREGALLAFAATARNQMVHDCIGTALPNSSRGAMFAAPGSSGQMMRCRIDNHSLHATHAGDWQQWTVGA